MRASQPKFQSAREIKMEKDILVSVNCITYNHAAYIRQCLDGFLMQKTNFRYEVLVHDDASTDGTADIIREYADRYPDIILPYYQTENQYSRGKGFVGGAINRRRARGKYIASCEGDDYWTDPMKLQKQVEYMEEHPDCTMCYTGFRNVDENGQEFFRGNYESMMRNSRSGDLLPMLLEGNFILTCTTMHRREVWQEPFFLNAPHHFDYVLFTAQSILGPLGYIPERTAAYRMTSTGAMATQHDRYWRMTCDTFVYFYEMILSGKIDVAKERITGRVYRAMVRGCNKMPAEYNHWKRSFIRKHWRLWPYVCLEGIKNAKYATSIHIYHFLQQVGVIKNKN